MAGSTPKFEVSNIFQFSANRGAMESQTKAYSTASTTFERAKPKALDEIDLDVLSDAQFPGILTKGGDDRLPLD